VLTCANVCRRAWPSERVVAGFSLCKNLKIGIILINFYKLLASARAMAASRDTQQVCIRGRGGVEDMCYERRRAPSFFHTTSLPSTFTST
jgi:hypothetical protein